ncbi:apolipoprotein N-acyltransferase [Azospirillum halopraeferens]|uniref:apolipoprotein N-acyltransferase n=1 Tax=Azospirillum halopraeferens TaxID=34010 RepID=UPI000426CA66|nr:apolipoprotein N-acyltransferase [Azospirillum halopraeferens]
MFATDVLTGDGPLRRAAAGLAGLAGWRRLAAAAALGGLSALALPPAHALPVLLVSFPGLLWLLAGAPNGRVAFAVGWFFGFGHHLAGLYWVSFALFTDIGRFWWALPLAAAGLPMLLSLFTGLAALVFHRLKANGPAAPLLFAATWAAAEWLRGHLFTGFPWNLTGYGWVGVLPVLQGVSLVGIYGLSLLTVLVAALPAALADPRVPPRRAAAALAAGLALFAALAAWGALRLSAADEAPVAGVRLRLVQAAVEQHLKWDPAERQANFERHLALTAAPAARPVTHVIWPETAVPFFLDADAARRQAVGAVTPPGGLVLTGAPRLGMAADGGTLFHNAMLALDGSGAVVASYDKFHLVPFGEYMPLRRYLPVGAIAGNGAEFSPGPGPRSLRLAGLPPVSPLICYEVIFPAAVTDPDDRPHWLLNLTNDAWYGHTAGPHQHFAIARVRAVEEGLPLVRSANTGISGVVDSYGRVTARLGLGERGIVDADLPAALAQPTPYGRFGDLGFGLLLAGCLICGLLARQSR